MPEQKRIHIYPVDKNQRTTHCTDKTGMCWCKPDLAQVCPEWTPEVGTKCPPECWRCGGADLVEPWSDERIIMIMHQPGQAQVPIPPSLRRQ